MNTNRRFAGTTTDNVVWALAIFAVAIIAIGGAFRGSVSNVQATANQEADITVYKKTGTAD